LEKLPSLKDILQVNSKRNTLLLKVLRSAQSLSTPITVQSNSHFGILLDNKNLEVLEKDITLELMLPFLCLMSPPESHIRMFQNGTKI